MHSATLHARFASTRTFGSLDGLRGIAVLAVVWHHTQPGVAWWPATTRGFLGVDLFFVLSGFLIVTLLLRERERTGGISLRRFWIRRSLRILPVYWLTLLAWTALAFLPLASETIRNNVRHDLPISLVYASNWVPTLSALGITWSLSSEEQFYLLWPPLEMLGRRVAYCVIALGVALSIALQLGTLDPWIGDARAHLAILQVGLTPILLGVALAHLLHSERGFAWASRVLAPRVAAPLALAAVVAIASVPTNDVGPLRPLLHVAMAALIASAVVREDHVLARLLAWRPLAHVGTLSYGLYLFHMLARDVAARGLGRFHLAAPWDAWALFAATLAIGLVAAEISHRVLERRMLALKKRWASDTPTIDVLRVARQSAAVVVTPSVDIAPQPAPASRARRDS